MLCGIFDLLKRLSLLVFFLVALLMITQGISRGNEVSAESFLTHGKAGEVPFFFTLPAVPSSSTTPRPVGVLLLIPCYNGSGEALLDARWREFADQHSLVLLAPTFHNTNPEELHHAKGYYYPEQGSGEQVEEALAEVHHRTGVQIDRMLIFGFSAGAHVAHRFALWKPSQVQAFVAYSAAWWSDPTASLRNVPALIMCGENDERYEATRAFMEKGLALHLPWIWRSYKNTDHQLTPAVRSMAEAFLGYYARAKRMGVPDYAGDIQTYRFLPSNQAESIAPAVRIGLPKELANIWAQEK